MLHPLATLWRHSARVTFYESGGRDGRGMFQGGAPGQAHIPGMRRRFSSGDEAFHYLRTWLGEPAARAELRWMLERLGPGSASAKAGADGWLHALAAQLVAGAIVVIEQDSRFSMPGRLVAPPAAAAGAAAVEALPPLSAAPALAGVPDLLPVLEDVRIEGAQVRPELEQSLAQVGSAIASVDAAALSLAPAPSRVAGIEAAMATASGAASATLEQL